jgi:hypothetical protein
MIRTEHDGLDADHGDRSAGKTAADEGRRAADAGAGAAQEIGMAALDLAQRARAAGLTTLGYLLEGVALEAGTEAAARQWPLDRPGE